MTNAINPGIFKAYDIRGVYPNELSEEAAYKIGQSFAKYSKAPEIMVGYDTRVSYPVLSKALIEGIIDQGVNVVDIGLTSTSCFYYSLAESGLEAGVMITASHNSKEFNGMKPMLKDATPLTKEQILELKELVMGDQISSSTKGQITTKDCTDDYVKMVRGSLKVKIKPLKVVMDAGNGMAGLYIEKIFSGIGLDLIPIYTELDGNFPNHETNPKLLENRAKLVEKILAEKANLGFMFDGDADRLCILDRQGEYIDYGLVMALLSEYLVKNSDKKKVIHEVRTSTIVRDWIERAGGTVEITECWTIPIKLKMKSDPEVVFGGETSGHYMFRETHESDDGIFGAMLFLQAISAKSQTIDEIIAAFKEKYCVLEETNFKMVDMDEAQKIIDNLKKKYSEEGATILEIDGLSVIYPDWWFNLRKSQSEPVIRLNMEANSRNLFEEKSAEVIALIKSKER
ncbi:MAG TPA: phosphomannomutase/phosphoglucomutase [Patescibacteria group bacterium]|nr:phosphomannomutase/phosphoglucomutase [Patescibacteria group bacterium]